MYLGIGEHDAYRSEISGVYGLVLIVNLPEDLGDIAKGEIEIRCDGLSVLRRGFDVGYEEISSKHAHIDILSKIHGL